MKQSLTLCALVAAVAFAVHGCGGRRDAPNVLLVTLDTTRADRLGCYGHESARTPHLDALSDRGARFERALSTAGLTPMSHASILTGLNNYRHGLRVFYNAKVSHRLDDAAVTLPELLAARGYRTGGFTSAYPVSEAYGLNQGFDVFDSGTDAEALDLTGQQRHETFWAPTLGTSTQRRGDATVDAALDWLAQDDDEPWAMWVHMFDAHDYSIVPPADWMASRGLTAPNAEPRGRRDKLELRETAYDPEIEWMDLQLGRILAQLEERGELDNTLVVVTADHGQGLTEGLQNHGWMKHRLLYDWCLRVPLIVAGPGVDRAVVPSQVRTTDVLPTLLDALDIASQVELDGASLMPLIRGERDAEPRLAYADALNLYDDHSPKAGNLPPGQFDNLYGLTDGRWKLIHHEQSPEASQLFDLARDPAELENLWAPDHPEALRLGRQLEDWAVNRVQEPGRGAGDGPSGAALRALGYGGGEGESEDER